MAILHAEPGQKIGIPLLEDAREDRVTRTLFKAAELEVMRMVVLKGKEIPSHRVAHGLTLQCLQGRVAVEAMGRSQELAPGELIYLPAQQPHTLRGIEDSSILLTLLL